MGNPMFAPEGFGVAEGHWVSDPSGAPWATE
jgi:hypothetical protein